MGSRFDEEPAGRELCQWVREEICKIWFERRVRIVVTDKQKKDAELRRVATACGTAQSVKQLEYAGLAWLEYRGEGGNG